MTIDELNAALERMVARLQSAGAINPIVLFETKRGSLTDGSTIYIMAKRNGVLEMLCSNHEQMTVEAKIRAAESFVTDYEVASTRLSDILGIPA